MFGSYLLPLDWVVSHGFWWALFYCLLICPVIPQLLGVVFVSYWPPLNPLRFQFWAYFPGNPFLAGFVASMATTYPRGGFHVNAWLNLAILIGAAIVCVALTWLDTKAYRDDQMTSANKVYHNFLYLWYAYLAVASYVGVWETDVSGTTKLYVSIPGVLWVLCLAIDNFTSKGRLKLKRQRAHGNNLPLWKNGWKLRHWTSNGYE